MVGTRALLVNELDKDGVCGFQVIVAGAKFHNKCCLHSLKGEDNHSLFFEKGEREADDYKIIC